MGLGLDERQAAGGGRGDSVWVGRGGVCDVDQAQRLIGATQAYRLHRQVTQQEAGEVAGLGVLSTTGDVQPDRPQSPGGVVVLALEAHPARLGGQARGGEVQPGPHLGGHLGVQQRQRPALLRYGEASHRPRPRGEVLP
ncbi:MAG: hypothetical protein ACRDQZ_02980, partial [Mycobacteriales bacterium]